MTPLVCLVLAARESMQAAQSTASGPRVCVFGSGREAASQMPSRAAASTLSTLPTEVDVDYQRQPLAKAAAGPIVT